MKQLTPKKADNLKAWFTLAKYSFKAGLRNPSSVFFGFLFPLIFIAIFGLLGQNKGVYDLVLRPDSSNTGAVYEALTKIESIHLITDSTNENIDDQLRKGQVPAAMRITENNIPGGFSTYDIDLELSVAAGQNAQVVQSIVDAVVKEINAAANANQIKVVDLKETMVEGRKFTQIDYILPGQLAFMLLTTGVYAVVFTLITLRSTLVIKRMFATPASKWIIILGEVSAKLLMAVLQTTVIILIGHFVFEFTLVNGLLTYLSMLTLAVFGLIVFMGFGFVIASLAKDENAASPIANLVTLPQMFLSGAFFSIEAFPAVIQPIAHILPMTFLNEAMRKVAFEGSTLLDVGPQLLGLTIWGIIVYVVAIKFFRWE